MLKPQPLPLLITKRDLIAHLGGRSKLLARMDFHKWLQPAQRGGRGRDTTYSYPAVIDAVERWLQDPEALPLLPSEIRRQKKLRELTTKN